MYLTLTEKKQDSPLVKWGLERLMYYWGRLFGITLSVQRQAGQYWLIRFSETVDSWKPRDYEGLDNEGYLLTKAGNNHLDIAIVANSDKGLLNGIFGLLRELGCGFYLGGSSIPPKPWRNGFNVNWGKVCNPIFHVRGLLPYHNFANSPTCWEVEDYKNYFDRMAEQQFNIAIFHAYEYEPHGAYPYKGKWHCARRNHVWAWDEESVDVTKFPKWAQRYFSTKRFGPPGVLATKTLEECIKVTQDIIKQGFQHAKLRGIKTCMGFELTGDPKVAEIRSHFLARMGHIINTYQPDYLGLWQGEGAALQGWSLPLHGSGWERDYYRYKGVFKSLGYQRRILEALRIAEFVKIAHDYLNRNAPNIDMVLSGWGGDQWMRMNDMFLGFDKILPDDVVFSALDNIDPTSSKYVAKNYGNLSKTRQRWPVAWLESDGGIHTSQWHPQSNVSSMEPLIKDAIRKGCQGFIGQHWRFSDEIEREVSYISQAYWQELSAKEFWKDYSLRCFGGEVGKSMSVIFEELENLGPGWTGLLPQSECGTFSWEAFPEITINNEKTRSDLENLRKTLWQVRPIIINRVRSLSSIFPSMDMVLLSLNWALDFGGDHRDRLKEIRARILKLSGMESIPESGKERMGDLIVWIDFIIGYDHAARLLKPGGEVEILLSESKKCIELNAPSQAGRLAKRALKLIKSISFEDALKAYSRKIRTQSQRANFARMCRDVWTSWQETSNSLRKIAEKT